MSCRRQGTLTQGTAPDPKCKLNISSFLTLPHLLNCLISARNPMSIVLLLQMMSGWDSWGKVDLYQRVGEGTGGGHNLIVFFTCAFVSFVLSCPKSLF